MPVDTEAATNGQHGSFDESAHQSAYVFAPSNADEHDAPVRPTKRRKVSKKVEKEADVSTEEVVEEYTFPRLLGGLETVDEAASRQRAFREIWEHEEKAIGSILNRFDIATVEGLDSFVRNTTTEVTEGKLPAALLVTGTGTSAKSKVLEQLETSWTKDKICLIQLGSGHATNLKLALRSIIRGVIVEVDGVDGYQTFFNRHKKVVPLNYDLELLYMFIQERNISRVILSLTESEAFDSRLLAELISVLHAWISRIPVVLLFQVATSVDLFEARLPSSAVRVLFGKKFHIESQRNVFEDLFQAVSVAEGTQVWFGPDTARMLLEQSREQLATPETMGLSMKYALMTHFFADPLTALLDSSVSSSKETRSNLCKAIRNTPSFRIYVEDLLNSRDAKSVKKLLEDDQYLYDEAIRAIQTGQESMLSFSRALDNLQKLLGKVNTKSTASFVDLYMIASTGEFVESPVYRDMMMSIKKMPSDLLTRLLKEVQFQDTSLADEVLNVQRSLENLLSTSKIPNTTIRSTNDTSVSTRTTISHDNRISLSSTPKKASALESKYTTILTQYHELLASFFSARLISPHDLFMSEVFIHNSKSPLSTAFTPRPRFAIERALTSPYDYLSCECCSDIRPDEVRATQPTTAILWRLWCEAGTVVNVRDLWEAFWNILRPKDGSGNAENDAEDNDDEDEAAMIEEGKVTERLALTLFYQSLADLRMLGFVKQTRKKADCVAKAVWKGL